MSVDVKWTDKGATISTLNAVKEFPILTKDVVDKAIDDGTLETKEGSFMGKSYTKLLRHQVKKLARQREKKQNLDAKGSNSSEEEEEEEEEEDEDEEEEATKREPKWSDKGATISDKNAVKEFPALTMESIEAALESGELESRVGNFMGKTYRKLLLHKVKELAEKHGGGGGGEAGEPKDGGETANLSSGERRKRIAAIEDQLEEIEEKKRKLLKEKQKLEKDVEWAKEQKKTVN